MSIYTVYTVTVLLLIAQQPARGGERSQNGPDRALTPSGVSHESLYTGFLQKEIMYHISRLIYDISFN